MVSMGIPGSVSEFGLPMPRRFPYRSSRVLGRMLIHFYVLVHTRLHLRGAGLLIRWAARSLPALWSVPYQFPGAGCALLDLRDQSAFGLLNYSHGDYGRDHRLLDYISGCLQPGSVLWDVGANAGCFSLYFSGPQFGLASIHAFEPNPVALRPLQSLFREHRTVKVHPVALGRGNEKRVMKILPHASVHSSFVRPLDGAEAVSIDIRSGDDLCRTKQAESPAVVKIDVEGFEAEVISGLCVTIARERPVVFFEHGWLSDGQLQEIRQVIPADYLLLFILDEALTPDLHARRGGNDAILVPPEKSELVQKLRPG